MRTRASLTRKYLERTCLAMLHDVIVKVLGCDDGLILYRHYCLTKDLLCSPEQIVNIVERFLSASERFCRLMDVRCNKGQDCVTVSVTKDGAQALVWARAHGFVVNLIVVSTVTLGDLIDFFRGLEETPVLDSIRRLAQMRA